MLTLTELDNLLFLFGWRLSSWSNMLLLIPCSMSAFVRIFLSVSRACWVFTLWFFWLRTGTFSFNCLILCYSCG